MKDKIYLRNTDLEDREKRNRIFNPETGISEDGTMHDCVYRPWINQPKKEQTMTREEAIEGINDKLKDLKYYAKEMGKVLKSTNYFIDELERQAKKVERPKLKAWHVRDEYSFKELQKELESKGIHKYKGQEYLPADFFKDNNSIYVFVENETWCTSSWDNLPSDRYIIEYHKEEPRYLLQTDLTSENGIQYLSFDKKRREYFMGALMTSENVQQKFTDSEILKIESITRFAKLCEKIVLNDGIKI